MLLAVLFFRSFYRSSEPGTPLHRDSIPSKPLRPHTRSVQRNSGFSRKSAAEVFPIVPLACQNLRDIKP